MPWNPKAQIAFANDLVTASLVLDEGSDTREAIQQIASALITQAVQADPTLAANVTTVARQAVDARMNEVGLVQTSSIADPSEVYLRGPDPRRRSWIGFRLRDGGIASRTGWAIVNWIHLYAGYDPPFVYPGNFVCWIDFNESGLEMFKKMEE